MSAKPKTIPAIDEAHLNLSQCAVLCDAGSRLTHTLMDGELNQLQSNVRNELEAMFDVLKITIQVSLDKIQPWAE